MLENCRILAVIRLPEDTFKPNKINVRASVLYLEKYETPDHDLENSYSITFCDIESLGYYGSGEPIRNFDWTKLLNAVQNNVVTNRREHQDKDTIGALLIFRSLKLLVMMATALTLSIGSQR